jgi:hypothetical protein
METPWFVLIFREKYRTYSIKGKRAEKSGNLDLIPVHLTFSFLSCIF